MISRMSSHLTSATGRYRSLWKEEELAGLIVGREGGYGLFLEKLVIVVYTVMFAKLTAEHSGVEFCRRGLAPV